VQRSSYRMMVRQRGTPASHGRWHGVRWVTKVGVGVAASHGLQRREDDDGAQGGGAALRCGALVQHEDRGQVGGGAVAPRMTASHGR
jgi:hypothetical protein